jgi:hypothetical protein
VLIITLNQSFYRLLLRQRGAVVVAAGLPLHIIHHLAGVAAVPAGVRRHLLGRRSRRPPSGGPRS